MHITLTTGHLVESDEVLVGTGRTPHTQDVGLDAVGLEPGAWLRWTTHRVWSRTTGSWWGTGGCTPPVTSTGACS
ncbi:hypothetical protein [Streptomyces sp. NPDC056627]|uniref:hypothetical protein n=1 Tax=unclassified Streptomyces TaxID=2593676 RepID=UPI000960101C|nr:hypothetical protein AMK10_20700 [Streptomyces sp. CB02058]